MASGSLEGTGAVRSHRDCTGVSGVCSSTFFVTYNEVRNVHLEKINLSTPKRTINTPTVHTLKPLKYPGLKTSLGCCDGRIATGTLINISGK